MFNHITLSPEKRPLTTREVADMFRVTRQCVRNWRVKGMPFVRIGRVMRYDYEEILNWVNDQNKPNDPTKE